MAHIVKQLAHHSSVCMCVWLCPFFFAQRTSILETCSLCTSNPQFASLFLTQNSPITDGLLYIHGFAFCIVAISADIHTLQHAARVSSGGEQDGCARSPNTLSLCTTLTKWEKEPIQKTVGALTFPPVCSSRLPVVKCVWWLYAVFWVWWPRSDGPRGVCVYTQLCSLCAGIVLQIQMLFLDKKDIWDQLRCLYSSSAVLVLVDTHGHPGTQTRTHTAEGHVQKTVSQMSQVLKE